MGKTITEFFKNFYLSHKNAFKTFIKFCINNCPIITKPLIFKCLVKATLSISFSLLIKENRKSSETHKLGIGLECSVDNNLHIDHPKISPHV